MARSEGGVIESGPLEVRSMGSVILRVHYVANVIARSDTSSKVTLVAYMTRSEPNARPEVVRSTRGGVLPLYWQRMERIASRIGTGSGT